jgi:hypothetical protein
VSTVPQTLQSGNGRGRQATERPINHGNRRLGLRRCSSACLVGGARFRGWRLVHLAAGAACVGTAQSVPSPLTRWRRAHPSVTYVYLLELAFGGRHFFSAAPRYAGFGPLSVAARVQRARTMAQISREAALQTRELNEQSRRGLDDYSRTRRVGAPIPVTVPTRHAR